MNRLPAMAGIGNQETAEISGAGRATVNGRLLDSGPLPFCTAAVVNVPALFQARYADSVFISLSRIRCWKSCRVNLGCSRRSGRPRGRNQRRLSPDRNCRPFTGSGDADNSVTAGKGLASVIESVLDDGPLYSFWTVRSMSRIREGKRCAQGVRRSSPQRIVDLFYVIFPASVRTSIGVQVEVRAGHRQAELLHRDGRGGHADTPRRSPV